MYFLVVFFLGVVCPSVLSTQNEKVLLVKYVCEG